MQEQLPSRFSILGQAPRYSSHIEAIMPVAYYFPLLIMGLI